MERIGLLGGMSWESSIEYYRLVNVVDDGSRDQYRRIMGELASRGAVELAT